MQCYCDDEHNDNVVDEDDGVDIYACSDSRTASVLSTQPLAEAAVPSDYK